MVEATKSKDAEWKLPRALLRNYLLATPLTLLIPISFGIVFSLSGLQLNWLAIAMGALGWVIALILRGPVALGIKQFNNQSPARAQTIIGWSSGPCEEIVRLAVILPIGQTFATAFSTGLGWTTIEIVYSLVSGIMTILLLRRTDEKAHQARLTLKSMGMDRLLTDVSPFLGILERISASALHIAHTLFIAWQPWLVLLTIPLHSSFNMLSVRLVRRSPLWAEIGMLLYCSLLLLVGLALFGRL